MHCLLSFPRPPAARPRLRLIAPSIQPQRCNDRPWFRRGLRVAEAITSRLIRRRAPTSPEAVVVAREGDGAILAGLKVHGHQRMPVEVALNRMSKWLVSGSLAFAALWKHDAESMWILGGAVINTLLSSVLKMIFNHQRPAPSLRSDPGMPSSHAQSIFYASTVLFLSWCRVWKWNARLIMGSLQCSFEAWDKLSDHDYWGFNSSSGLLSGCSWLRVSQRLHTLNQVLVGAIIGSAYGAVWFVLWKLLVHEVLASSPLVQSIVVVGSAAFWVGFIMYIILHCLKDE
ncbi:hypothetical protein ACP4OV_018002 [Aristida adscensionis]